ncbi:hypothetical protein H1Z61_16360 [Bacillus aquiflavi]|uniref:Uncharacterized protein n=1 Tax=Bacillus aquiflavi TaxID=2672567 RepID=A0A7W2AFY5_9BACI|nr:hypothetical protein [Bacillus aquiflavi]MBA4538654.1 hypothetical protein [Bacillus aquiflavi]UAC48536.1 hypothetical protein K6959_00585 [Bacillus aquiflavi]
MLDQHGVFFDVYNNRKGKSIKQLEKLSRLVEEMIVKGKEVDDSLR